MGLAAILEALETIDRRLEELPECDYAAIGELLKVRARTLAELCALRPASVAPDTVRRLRDIDSNGRRMANRLRQARIEAGHEYAEFTRRQHLLRGFQRDVSAGPARIDYTV